MDADVAEDHVQSRFRVAFWRHSVAAFGGLVIAAAVDAWLRGVSIPGAVIALVSILALPLIAALLVYTAAMQSVTTRWQAVAWSPLIGVVTLSPMAWAGAGTYGSAGNRIAAAIALATPALLPPVLAMPRPVDVTGDERGVLGTICLGVGIGAIAVLAPALAIQDDWSRINVYVAASALSGIYPGWLKRDARVAAAGSLALGQYVAAFAWISSALRISEGLALVWPMFVVPAGLAVMAGVAAVTVIVRAQRRG